MQYNAQSSRDLRLLQKVPNPNKGFGLLSHKEALTNAVLDDDSIDILRSSSNGYSTRRVLLTNNIINDFFMHVHFQGQEILDLGPGQYAFSLLARYLGGKVTAVDFNEPFITVGRKLNFRVIEHDMYKLNHNKLGKYFDGLWLKGAFSILGRDARGEEIIRDEEFINDVVYRLKSLLKTKGWAWVAPNHNVIKAKRKNSDDFVNEVLRMVEVQKDAFVNAGFSVYEIADADRKSYALHTEAFSGSRYIFLRNLIFS
jgi:predicted rRNA methylase YqxC with S4 and FtsJ domains